MHCRLLCALALALLLSWGLAGPALGDPPTSAPPAAPARDPAAQVDALLDQFRQQYFGGENQAAEATARRCLSLAEKHLGAQHDKTGSCLNNLAAALFAQRRYDEALQHNERALAITERSYGAGHPQFALALGNRAQLMITMGQAAAAVAVAERAAAIVEGALGADHPLLSTMLITAGEARLRSGQVPEAIGAFERALVIRQKSLGAESLEVAEALHWLAEGRYAQGRLSQAIELRERAIAIEEKHWGADDRRLAARATTLGIDCEQAGQVAEARRWLERALAIHGRADGPEHPDTAVARSNLASVLLSAGEYRRAGELAEQAVAVLAKHLPASAPELITARSNRALAHYYTGDYEAATEGLEALLLVLQDKHGPEAPELAGTLSNLAEIDLLQGRYGQAEQRLRRAVAIRRKALPAGDPSLGTTLLNLAAALSYGDKLDEADAVLSDTILLLSKALGDDHPQLARALNNRARLNEQRGNRDQSAKLYERAIAIMQKRGLGDLPDTAAMLENLAFVKAPGGDIGGAIQLLRQANTIRRRLVDLLISAGSERQKAALVAAQAVRADYALAVHLELAPDHAGAAELALTTLLGRKGRVLDAVSGSLRALRGRLAPADRAVLDELFEVRAELAAALFGGRGLGAERKAELSRRARELEQQLSQKSEAFAAEQQPVTIAAVRERIPAEAALIELTTYRAYDPAKPADPWGERKYGAYVLRRDQEPRWVSLGPAEAIDTRVKALRQQLSDPRSLAYAAPARRLYQQLMAPLVPLLGGATRLLIAPDGLLNLLPFDALIDDQGQYVISRFTLSYLTSGRELLRLDRRPPSRGGPVIVADPSFSQPPPGAPAAAGSRTGGTGAGPAGGERAGADSAGAEGAAARAFSLHFTPLPGTAAEAQAIGSSLPGATVLTGPQATKQALRELGAPLVLHLATHGFFLADQPPVAAGTRALSLVSVGPAGAPQPPPIDNPLLRSGLAFAGANEARADNPGVLSALEASGLDLQGTRLVVLSACDTGLGEVKNGEGVYGLRRAFVIAGAETQVMSLWKVDDLATRDLMVAYYRGLRAGQGRRDALRQAQLTLAAQERTKHPAFWAGFIVSGSWQPLEELAGQPVGPPKVGCACRLGAPAGKALPAAPSRWGWLLLPAGGWLIRRRRAKKGASRGAGAGRRGKVARRAGS